MLLGVCSLRLNHCFLDQSAPPSFSLLWAWCYASEASLGAYPITLKLCKLKLRIENTNREVSIKKKIQCIAKKFLRSQEVVYRDDSQNCNRNTFSHLQDTWYMFSVGTGSMIMLKFWIHLPMSEGLSFHPSSITGLRLAIMTVFCKSVMDPGDWKVIVMTVKQAWAVTKNKPASCVLSQFFCFQSSAWTKHISPVCVAILLKAGLGFAQGLKGTVAPVIWHSQWSSL